MYVLSDYNRFLIALSLVPRLGLIKITKILSPCLPEVIPHTDHLYKNLTPKQFLAVSSYLSGYGELVAAVDNIESQLFAQQIALINFHHSAYPMLLKQIADPPIFIFCKGNVETLAKPQIAIVGSRNASSSSLRHAYDFASRLSDAGLVVTSGLAQGVDGASHSGAVQSGGVSIAVMGTGLDTIYPKCHQTLAHKILDNGCWVSEYFPGSSPVAANFPRRNRIISGLSLGVLVVEAKLKSGTLITARTAIEQNREVFAIPGPIEYAGSVGCHNLISQGATLVQSIDDILFGIDFSPLDTLFKDTDIATKSCMVLEPALQGLLEIIEYSPMLVSELLSKSSLLESDLISMLVELELQGVIEKNGAYVIRLL